MQYISRLSCSDLERVIIVDCEIPVGQKESFLKLVEKEAHLIVVDAHKLCLQLEDLVNKSSVLSKGPVLFVFPGGGGERMKRLSSIHSGQPTAEVFARRIWIPGSDPFVCTGEIITAKFIHPEVLTVFLLDDVISSGQTITKIFQRSVWKFPRARWYTGTLISRGWKVSNYTEIFSALVVTNSKTPGKKVPINTLGALLNDPEMARSYALRNLENSQEFLDILDLMRKPETA